MRVWVQREWGVCGLELVGLGSGSDARIQVHVWGRRIVELLSAPSWKDLLCLGMLQVVRRVAQPIG